MPKPGLSVVAAIAIAALLVSPAAAITFGSPDGDAHPYVGLVVFHAADGSVSARCSGSLLSANVFLASGHCASLSTGGTAAWADVWISAHVAADTPADATGVPVVSPDGAIAIVALASSLHSGRYASLPEVGLVDSLANKASLTIVGFGVTDQDKIPGNPIGRWNDGGDRVQAASALVSGTQSTSDDLLKHSNGPGGSGGGGCFHDSGGPIELGTSDIVLAINAYVDNANCTGIAYGSRIDTAARLAWIGWFLP